MPRGRPPKKFTEKDGEKVFRLGRRDCTDEEIAASLGTTVETLQKNFSECLERARAEGRISLRAKQFLMAMGSPAKPAVYLREHQDENGRQYGELVKDKDGNLIKIQEEQPARLPNMSALIWLGKNRLKQGDRVIFEEPKEWEI